MSGFVEHAIFGAWPGAPSCCGYWFPACSWQNLPPTGARIILSAAELSDGARDLFEPNPNNMVARSQFPDRRDFQGWIVFNPAVTLTPAESYRISVHEIGHMLGLKHNPNTRSLMYDLDLECSDELDATDFASLRAHHKLRVSAATETVKFAQAR
jgi:hypothetical protein